VAGGESLRPPRHEDTKKAGWEQGGGGGIGLARATGELEKQTEGFGLGYLVRGAVAEEGIGAADGEDGVGGGEKGFAAEVGEPVAVPGGRGQAEDQVGGDGVGGLEMIVKCVVKGGEMGVAGRNGGPGGRAIAVFAAVLGYPGLALRGAGPGRFERVARGENGTETVRPSARTTFSASVAHQTSTAVTSLLSTKVLMPSLQKELSVLHDNVPNLRCPRFGPADA